MDFFEPLRRRASTALPHDLFLQLEPYLDKLEPKQDRDKVEQYMMLGIQHKFETFDKINEDYENKIQAEWPAFARQQWPEIDEHFDLEGDYQFVTGRYDDNDDDLPVDMQAG